MAEINDLNITDASNIARWPENMAPSAVNDAGRADEGLLARWHKDTNASKASTGSANAYVFAADQTLGAYYDGLEIAFDANFANTGAATLNVDALGAIAIKKYNDQDIALGDIRIGQKVVVVYDGASFQMSSPTASHTNGLNALAFGAVGDLVVKADAAMTASDATLTSATGQFTAADAGKSITVHGAGAAGINLVTTIASFTSATSVELTVAASTTVSAEDYSYGTNDSTAIASLLSTLVTAAERQTVVLAKSANGIGYRLDSALTVDMSFVTLKGEKVLLDFSGMTTGDAITVTGTENPPRHQGIMTFEDFIVEGGDVVGTRGIVLDGTNPPGPSRTSFSNVYVEDFPVGWAIEDATYLISWYNCTVNSCTTGITYKANPTNSVENYRWFGGLIAENGLDLDINDRSDWYFYGTSFDASDQVLSTSVTSGTVIMDFVGCHFEKVGGTWASAPFKMDGAAALKFWGGSITQGTNPGTLDYLFDHSNSSNRVGGVWLHGTKAANMFTANDKLYNGQGRFAWSDMIFDGSTTGVERPHSTEQSVLIDGGFESVETIDIKDDWSIVASTGNTPTAFDTSPRVTLANQAVTFRSGSRALEMSVITDGCVVGLFIKLELDQYPMFNFWYQWSAAPTSAAVELRWSKGYIDPTTRIWHEIDQSPQKFTTNILATTWTKVICPAQGGVHAAMNPGGYNMAHLYFRLLTNVAGKSLFIDDAVANVG